MQISIFIHTKGNQSSEERTQKIIKKTLLSFSMCYPIGLANLSKPDTGETQTFKKKQSTCLAQRLILLVKNISKTSKVPKRLLEEEVIFQMIVLK